VFLEHRTVGHERLSQFFQADAQPFDIRGNIRTYLRRNAASFTCIKEASIIVGVEQLAFEIEKQSPRSLGRMIV